MFKRVILSAIALLALLAPFTITTVASAYNPLGKACSINSDATNNTAACDTGGSTSLVGSDNIFVKTARIIALLAGAAAVILIIVSGIQIITANGDANSIANGRRTIIYAIVGIVVIALAQAIISVVIGRLS